MKTTLLPPTLRALLLALCCGSAIAAPVEHKEFEATLHAPFQADASARRTFSLSFHYPGLERPGTVDWTLELVTPQGRVSQRWRGSRAFSGAAVPASVTWNGRIGTAPAPAGLYRLRLHAGLRGDHESLVEQEWQIAVGSRASRDAPSMPAFAPLPGVRDLVNPANPAAMAPATGSLPYTVYLANLHSQSNHSDGGAALTECKGAQDPLKSKYGPEAAFAYARGRGLDVLAVSEHNHMYDGSDGTAADGDPAAARALYKAGLASAAAFNATKPGFLALYGMEWGVINNGGHINIFNSDELLGWEKNAKGELMADTLSPRNDYAALYTRMRERGWVGQFNHPAQQGQFAVNGVALGYTPDGDEAMALCEVMNSTAFSTNDTETETRRSNFEHSCNRLLEAGYHLAFSTNQDNHCANWGASYTNRTGVLLPNGAALTRESFMAALKARRVFATMDKTSQLVFTANGKLMGERFTNRGPLTLKVNFASTSGKKAAAVAIMEGVPMRGGTVTQLSSTAITKFTPASGQHFYYAKVTQDDGNVLWSAPVWVTQE
ncbi:CehA/McbA family metallohydrolase [Telluria aromaticivorans]|uniref:CehA/McbA family metallohydrolase n=1 Tax=Telluria aromaticivorans TaxID=2725995 RepID=A0A7Y2JZT0_9BURK|nr:CehA/McbA family metallohydrolase [Telluria aromaticivorans]NNG24047.1 CehA/McbA family metallohydrolase [Telluria aromaticivorans]